MRALVGMVAVCTLVACGTDEPKPALPAPLPTVDPPAAAGPIRTVGYRNPLGNTRVVDNLMVDGDFELTGRTGQMPWQAFDKNGQATLSYDTGGRCRSGVRCGSITKGQNLVGYFAVPETGSVAVTIYGKPDTGKCTDLRAYVYDLTGTASSSSLVQTMPTPDATGWCTYSGVAKGLARLEPVIYLDDVGGRVLVDEAVALPVSGKLMLDAVIPPPMDGATQVRARDIAEWIHRNRPYGMPRRNAD